MASSPGTIERQAGNGSGTVDRTPRANASGSMSVTPAAGSGSSAGATTGTQVGSATLAKGQGTQVDQQTIWDKVPLMDQADFLHAISVFEGVYPLETFDWNRLDDRVKQQLQIARFGLEQYRALNGTTTGTPISPNSS